MFYFLRVYDSYLLMVINEQGMLGFVQNAMSGMTGRITFNSSMLDLNWKVRHE